MPIISDTIITQDSRWLNVLATPGGGRPRQDMAAFFGEHLTGANPGS